MEQQLNKPTSQTITGTVTINKQVAGVKVSTFVDDPDLNDFTPTQVVFENGTFLLGPGDSIFLPPLNGGSYRVVEVSQGSNDLVIFSTIE